MTDLLFLFLGRVELDGGVCERVGGRRDPNEMVKQYRRYSRQDTMLIKRFGDFHGMCEMLPTPSRYAAPRY